MNNFGISTNVTFWGAPAPEAHTICCTSHWLNPKEEWRIINIVSSVCKPVSSFETMQESPLSLCSSCSPGAQLSQTKKRDEKYDDDASLETTRCESSSKFETASGHPWRCELAGKSRGE